MGCLYFMDWVGPLKRWLGIFGGGWASAQDGFPAQKYTTLIGPSLKIVT